MRRFAPKTSPTRKRGVLSSLPTLARGAGRRRAGLTLFEVVIAMAIFAISLIPIHQLITLATERAIDVKLQARTSSLCQSKMSEVIIGAESLQPSGGYNDIPDQKDIQWKMEANEVVSGLYEVKIWVKAQADGGRFMESHLVRMVLDPSVRGSTLEDPPAASAGTATPSTDNSATPSNATTPTTPTATTPTAPATTTPTAPTKKGS